MRAVSVLSLSLLLAMSGIAISGMAAAQSRVGVTSGTSGDPLGKPPAEAERVLRVGVDVKANEAITTGTADRAHLLFLDGSSLTVGPQARLTIDKFIYDPATKLGDLAVHATEGVFRFVGGRISKTRPVSVVTPSAALTIRGGIMLIDVQPTKTVATFVFGVEMTVIANGVKQTVNRPGWQVTTFNGTAPTNPVQATPGSLSPNSPSWKRCGRNLAPAIPTRPCKARASTPRIPDAARRAVRAASTRAASATPATPSLAPTARSRSRRSFPNPSRAATSSGTDPACTCCIAVALRF